MQTSGIKIDINSENLLVSNSKKIEKVIKFAVKQAVENGQKKLSEEKLKNHKKNDSPK